MSVVVDQGPEWWALDKPAGIPVFPPHGSPDGDCLLSRWAAEQPGVLAANWPAGFEGGIAHRLDTPTSGQVIAAARPEALAWIRALFSASNLRKTYRFVSDGEVSWDAHHVQHPIAHDKGRRSRMIAQRGKNTPHRGKWYAAHTRLRRVGLLVDGGGMWEAEITTGVMHQIRVHCASVGLPLRGDKLYGGGPPVGERHGFWLHHLGLHGPDLAPRQVPLPPGWPALSGNLE